MVGAEEMTQEDDLALLGLRSDERRKLEAMGITTLEQIVMLGYQLGLGKDRDHTVTQGAQNILTNRHFSKIELEAEGRPRKVKVYANRTDNIFAKVVGKALYAEVYGCSVEKTTDGFIIVEGNQPFDPVLKQAELFKDILGERKIQEDKRRGITFPREEIIGFARERGFEHFWQTVFEEIKGNELMKIAVACSIFSSPFEPVHLLIVGDPASAKTMAKDVIVQNFSDVQLIGANSTAAGLVVNKMSGEPGALSFSDQKIVLIDEFDKIPPQDIEYTYELLSNGMCRVDAARIHETIKSHFSAIALANPAGQTFSQGSQPMEQIGLPPALMSRFALVVRSENIGGEELEDLVMRKIQMTAEIRSLGRNYDQWVKLARTHQPAIKCSDGALRQYSTRIRELVERYQATPLRRDARMADYARRLPMALARSEFRDAEESDLEKALEIFRSCLGSWA